MFLARERYKKFNLHPYKIRIGFLLRQEKIHIQKVEPIGEKSPFGQTPLIFPQKGEQYFFSKSSLSIVFSNKSY
jgi:hypothetical protein